MATKKTSKRPAAKRASNKPPKKAAKKRSSKAPTKAARKSASKAPTKAASKAPKKGASAKKTASAAPRKRRTTLSPGRANRPTQPARPRAKKAAAKQVPMSVPAPAPAPKPISVAAPVAVQPPTPVVQSAPAPAPATPPPPKPATYLDSLPQDPAALVAGLFQVVRGAAKDLRTLFAQALAIGQKNDRHDR